VLILTQAMLVLGLLPEPLELARTSEGLQI
jgi:hypothetical protein